MGARVLNGAVIGERCLVGAGALVTEGKIFEPQMLIVGMPARAIRALTEQEMAGWRCRRRIMPIKRRIMPAILRRYSAAYCGGPSMMSITRLTGTSSSVRSTIGLPSASNLASWSRVSGVVRSKSCSASSPLSDRRTGRSGSGWDRG